VFCAVLQVFPYTVSLQTQLSREWTVLFAFKNYCHPAQPKGL